LLTAQQAEGKRRIEAHQREPLPDCLTDLDDGTAGISGVWCMPVGPQRRFCLFLQTRQPMSDVLVNDTHLIFHKKRKLIMQTLSLQGSIGLDWATGHATGGNTGLRGRRV